MIRKILPLISFSAIIIFFGTTCKKDSSNSAPPTSFYIDVTSIQYSALDHDGGYMYLTGGYKGILVYRSINDFYAYDRLCTLKSDSCLPVVMDKSNLFAIDTKCKSKYLILDGSPNSGPSKYPLIKYQTTFDGQFVHVFN